MPYVYLPHLSKYKRCVGQCSCKVGGCRKCGSACRRCKWACDGVAPLDALNRKVGKVAKKSTGKQTLQRTSITTRRNKRRQTKNVVGGDICTLNENDIPNDVDDEPPTATQKDNKQVDNTYVCVEVTDTTTSNKKPTRRDEDSEKKVLRLSN